MSATIPNTNMAQNQNTNIAQKMLLDRRVTHAKKGIILGIIGGASWGLASMPLLIGGNMFPFYDPSFSLNMIILGAIAIAGLNDTFAAIWLLLFNSATGKRKEYWRAMRTKPGLITMLGAVMGGPVAMSGYLIGTLLAGPTYALSISAIFPAIGSIFGMLFLKEKSNLRLWAGIIITIGGAILVGFSPPEGDYPYFYVGILCSLLPAIGWATEGQLSTFGMDMFDPDVSIGIRQISSSLLYLLIVFPIVGLSFGLGGTGYQMFFSALQFPVLVFWVAIAGLFSGAMGYLLYYRSLNMAGIQRGMALNVTYAVWTIPFGLLFSAAGFVTYSVALNAVFGAIILTIGVILVIGHPKDIISLRNVG